MKSFGGGQYGHIIEDRKPEDILKQLAARGMTEGHFTNGTFTLHIDLFTPLMLAAQKRVLDVMKDGGNAPLITAINSDVSMLKSYEGKDNERELSSRLIPELQRASNVVVGLARMFPERPTAVIFYDEQTPLELYRGLSAGGFGMKSLYKIGYGTKKDDKPIIGARFFEKVFAFPMPFDADPVMHADTRDATSTDRYPDVIEKLTEVCGEHGHPYIDKEGKILMPVPASLHAYAAPSGHNNANGIHLKR